jgi:hypothetical protein
MTDRPTTASRGYGYTHEAMRKRWQVQVSRGTVECGLCRQLIDPASTWDLSHPMDDKQLAPVPWHAYCNRSYAARVTRPRRAGRSAPFASVDAAQESHRIGEATRWQGRDRHSEWWGGDWCLCNACERGRAAEVVA